MAHGSYFTMWEAGPMSSVAPKVCGEMKEIQNGYTGHNNTTLNNIIQSLHDKFS